MINPRTHLLSDIPSQINSTLDQLQGLWESRLPPAQSHFLQQTNQLLIKYLDLTKILKVKKPDWQSLFLRQVNAVISFNYKTIPAFYIEIASQILKEFSGVSLKKMLEERTQRGEENYLRAPGDLKVLKLDYLNQVNNSKLFPFIEKISVKTCLFAAKAESQEFQSVFQHYLLGITVLSRQQKLKMKKIVLAAFDYYCFYCIRMVNKNFTFSLNILSILSNILAQYGSEEESQILLYKSIYNFISLLQTEPMQNLAAVANTPDIIENLSQFILRMEAKQPQSCSLKLLDHLCTSMIVAKNAHHFVRLVDPTQQKLFPSDTVVEFSRWVISLRQFIAKIQENISERSMIALLEAVQDNKNWFRVLEKSKSEYILACLLNQIIAVRNNCVVDVLSSINFSNLLGLAEEKGHISFLRKWRPLHQLAGTLIGMMDCIKKHEKFIDCCDQYLFFCNILDYFQKGSIFDPPSSSLIAFCTSLSKSTSISGILRIIYCLNRLSFTRFSKCSYHCLSAIFSNLDPHQFQAQRKISHHIQLFRMTQNGTSTAIENRERSIYFHKTLQMEIKYFIKAINLSTKKEGIFRHFQSYLAFAQIVALIGQEYQTFQEDSLEQILALLLNNQSDDFFLCISSIITRESIGMISRPEFCELSEYRQTLLSNLKFYEKVLFWRGILTTQEKVDIVDFTFNIKSDLYSLFSRFQRKNYQIRQFIQNVADRVDIIEMRFLGRSAEQYISHLGHILEEQRSKQMSLLASVSLKNVYYLMYPSGFSFESANEYEKAKDEEGLPKKEFQFIYDELQTSASTMKNVKQKCSQFQKMFASIKYSTFGQDLTQSIQQFDIRLKNDRELQPLLAQLHDLTYVCYLVGLESFKNRLISFRLSLVKKYIGLEIFLFQLARLLFLQILTQNAVKDISYYLENQIQTKKEVLSENVLAAINLLLTGTCTDKLFESRSIYRMIYFMKQNPLCYVNHFKPIFAALSMNVFSFYHFPFEIHEEFIVLKMSQHSKLMDGNRRERWLREIWEEDWSHLRIIVLFLRKLMEKAIDLHELSRFRTLLKFSLILLTRSGHLEELALPLKALFMRKKDINFLQVADSLRKVISSEINVKEYRKIDNILGNKRKSLSWGFKLEGFAKVVNNSFESGGKIGQVLAQIFMMIVFDMFDTNAWDRFQIQSMMPIYSWKYPKNKRKMLASFKNISTNHFFQNLAVANDILNSIPSFLFSSFEDAQIVRDYIAQFTNEAIDNHIHLSALENEQVDRIILRIALMFEEFNFVIKKFWSENSFPLSLREISLSEAKRTIDKIVKHFEYLQNNYLKSVEDKIRSFKAMKYPLSIIYPLGDFVVSIACKGTPLVTFMKKHEFNDKMEVCEGIVRTNTQITKSKQLNTPLNFKKRRGLDSELGKLVFSTDVGILDFDLFNFPSSIINSLAKLHPALPKFLFNTERRAGVHLQMFVNRNKLGCFEKVRQKVIEAEMQLMCNYQRIPDCKHQNLLMYVHHQYIPFPFEGVKACHNFEAIYRVPSFQYVQQNSMPKRSFNMNFCKYLINTKNDLPETENKFKSFQTKFSNWTGIVGRKPPLQHIIHLFDRDIYLYMGHGTGLEHISSTEYINFSPKCVMLVFGCSSSQMTLQNSQPFGCTFDFLLRGCPAYLGCLWTVTDIDLDRITVQLMESGSGNLSGMLKKCKSKCSYPNLNAASVVVYGLPSYLQKS